MQENPRLPSNGQAMKNRLKFYRQQLHMTQAQFAAFLGVHRVTLNRWENQREQPSAEWLYKIWQRLKTEITLDMQDLLSGE